MDFTTVIEQERQRLSSERQVINSQLSDSNEKMAELDRELAAIDAYEAAKTGKAPRSAQSSGNRTGQRARRGSRRDGIIEALRVAAGRPMRRSALLEHFGVKGDKAGEMSISNALTALSKSGQIVRTDGGYVLG